MTSPTPTVKRPLTMAELDTVQRAVEAETSGSDADIAAVTAIFELLHPAWGSGEQIIPGDVSIPQDQITTIMSWCAEHYAANPNERLTGLLSVWVNLGPSNYER